MGKRYIEIFCREAEEHLASLQSGLLVLEKHPTRMSLLHELLRNAHTLKGSARMVGLSDISAITHTMEEQLKGMEQGNRPVDAPAIDLLLKGTDAVALITSALSKGEPPPLDVEAFVADYERGEVGRSLASVEPQEVIPDQLSETVRANVKSLDALVNLIGEMIINKKRLEAKLTRLRGIEREVEGTAADLLVPFRRDLEEDILYLDYLIAELHQKAMELRMFPLKSICDGFERMVRDLAQAQGKEVRLETVGANIEMDRVLLEGLKPMLIHLLTNAVCHGIEPPDQRESKGKSRQGSVRITARHEGSSVVVEVRDDGKGMDPVRIKAAAVARGLIDQRDAEAMRDEEALYLTLRPGFSTAEVVTDVAGRGVGMDVVKKNVERIKGNLTMTSQVGSHTEISLQLPLSLSVLDALIVASGGETFAIPINYVQEILRVGEDEITPLGGSEVIKVRGTTTPVYSLSDVLELPRRQLLPGARLTALVLKLCDQRIAFTVDAHLGNSEVVVKGLGKQFRNVTFLFGATILGDGNPALILNVPDLYSAVAEQTRPGLQKSWEVKVQQRVLVVDDSITTRTMEQSILTANGYLVETAVCGEDALEKAAVRDFDLVISDVEMPGINGFQLTRQLRATDRHRETPVIIVSSLSRDEDKRQAMEAGAQAYIVKGSFDQGMLLETVQMLIG
ncbi:hybrid sensor histidine kinase/response regulator [Geomonas sp. Red32]|uniref:hybrid sensor histidine kinase/response regulator n=1 Tax=Geomonas sp. Red32 TaxID=2912856 RepID=UPI00202CB5D2|nr:hybrid sensor histidine kinase/response regulator [Geomonas sp. Red32]MCM0081698.1 hybrid sensor histidine kinase/response regulator [Geomonas sp. Red32]